MWGLRTIRAVFWENLGLKVLSLSLAVVLWLVVRGEQKAEQIYNVPLEVKNLASDLTANESLTDSIKVILRGSRTNLLSLSPQQVKLSLDLKGAREGERFYFLGPENLDTPPGIEVISVDPSRVKLKLEAVSEKTVEVFPQIRGKPAKNYEVVRITTEPEEVKVIGPKSIINGLRRLETLPVKIDGARDKVMQEVGFDIGDKKIKIQDYKQVVVTVSIVHKDEIIR